MNVKQSGRKASSSTKPNVWTEDDTSEEDIKPDIEDFSCKSRSYLTPLFKWFISEVVLFLYKAVNIQLYILLFTGLELDQLDEMEKKLNKSRPKRGGKKSRK